MRVVFSVEVDGGGQKRTDDSTDETEPDFQALVAFGGFRQKAAQIRLDEFSVVGHFAQVALVASKKLHGQISKVRSSKLSNEGSLAGLRVKRPGLIKTMLPNQWVAREFLPRNEVLLVVADEAPVEHVWRERGAAGWSA